jgi:hypothetical protein
VSTENRSHKDFQHLGRRQKPHPRSDQLDGEWQSIQSPTDFREHRRDLVAHRHGGRRLPGHGP